jgi:hypothetical protein
MDDLKEIVRNVYVSNMITADIDFLPSDIRCRRYFIPTKNKDKIFNNYYDDIAARIILESQKTQNQKEFTNRNNWVGLSHIYLLNQIIDDMKIETKINFFDKAYAKFIALFDKNYVHVKEPFSPIATDINSGGTSRLDLDLIIIEMNKEKLIKTIQPNTEKIYFPTNKLITTAFYKQEYN